MPNGEPVSPGRDATHPARRPMEIPRPGVVAQPFPDFQHVVERGPRQGPDGGKAPHPAFVVRDDGRNLRLLKHDLRDPDGVRMARASPGEVAGGAAKPAEERDEAHRMTF